MWIISVGFVVFTIREGFGKISREQNLPPPLDLAIRGPLDLFGKGQ
jgi:hypothetical protein